MAGASRRNAAVPHLSRRRRGVVSPVHCAADKLGHKLGVYGLKDLGTAHEFIEDVFQIRPQAVICLQSAQEWLDLDEKGRVVWLLEKEPTWRSSSSVVGSTKEVSPGGSARSCRGVRAGAPPARQPLSRDER